ncbi:MAG: hypothetical protein E7163_00700 [Firmicutes bacterium]|nr:hypothetical protein [Bacillota bacterium]
MNEKVVVSSNVPHYMPNFKNTIFDMAEKQALRKVIIDEIININFTNGIAPLIKELNGLCESEINEIFSMWYFMNLDLDDYDYNKLIVLYEEPLRSGDITKIEVADLYFYQNIEKFKKSLGRG